MTEDTSSSIPIFLCCAEDSEVFLVRVVDALHKEGMAPEVISGVDEDPTLLSNLVDRTRGAALFVLCQSDALDKTHARRLTGLFSARKGPCQKIITVQLYESRPLSVLPGIRAGIKEVRRARDAAAAKAGTGERVNLREVVGPVAVSAVPPSTAKPAIPRDDQLPDLDGIDDPERLARELHEEMVAAEAILDRRRDTGRKARTPGRSIDESRLDLPDLDATGAAPEPDRRASSPARAEADAPPSPSDGPEPGAPAALLDTAALATVPLDAGEIGEEAEEDPEDDTSPGKNIGEVTGPHASMSASAVPARRSSVRMLVAVAGAGALGLIAFSVLQRDDAPQPEGAPANPAERRSAAHASPDEAREPAGSQGASPGASEPTSETEEAAGAEPPEVVPARGRTVPPPPKEVDRESAAIEQAIEDGQMRLLEPILMLPPTSDTMTWDSARAHCRAQRVAAIGDWRLPSKAEVTRLRRAKLIPNNAYWTRQKGDAPDEAIAWDARSDRWVVWLTVEPNARAVCVRRR